MSKLQQKLINLTFTWTIMWTDEQLKQYTRDCIQKYPQTPSGIVLKSYYLGNNTIKGEMRFDQQRSIVEREIQIFNQIK